ncbi:MAG TPA: HD domain-containing phosphohydrolase [Thermoanaerobaculia bacterium]|nr:HD domain-containing phosphohydrolase [Thermoanaerobaculia bacterium]
MHQEVEELRPKLKEVLYDCAVEIRATKAALYLFDGTSKFELVTEYGFRGAVRNAADFNDSLVDRCMRARTPFFVNGLAAEPRLSELLYEASTDRLLAAPIFSRGKLIGIVDMRDKAAKLPFEQADVAKAQQIADRFTQLLADKAIFGHRFIALSKLSGQHDAAASEPGAPVVSAEPPVREKPNVPPPQPPPQPQPQQPPAAAPPIVIQRPPAAAPATAPAPQQTAKSHTPRLASLVLEARTAASRIIVAPAPESMAEAELNAAREVLRAILLIPGAVSAMLSAYGHMGGVQEIAARSTLADDAKNLIQSKLNVWLTKRGEAGGFIRTSVLTPFGTSGPPVTAADVQKVFTAPVNAGSLRGIYLTVVFGRDPDRLAHDLLAVLHSHLQLVIDQSMSRGTVTSLQARIADKLVEPDFSKYPELRRHTEAVSRLAESLARQLALSAAEIEQARIVGLVHDVGLRLLEYDRLYRKRDLSQEEMGFLREHPVVGAAMVEPLLGADIARAVLCHHERVDGRGYPNDLAGDEIPLIARVVQICDAWVAMTDPESYQAPQTHDAALATVSRAAGGQFDAGMAAKFVEMMRR